MFEYTLVGPLLCLPGKLVVPALEKIKNKKYRQIRESCISSKAKAAWPFKKGSLSSWVVHVVLVEAKNKFIKEGQKKNLGQTTRKLKVVDSPSRACSRRPVVQVWAPVPRPGVICCAPPVFHTYRTGPVRILARRSLCEGGFPRVEVRWKERWKM